MEMLQKIAERKEEFEFHTYRVPDTLLINPDTWRAIRADVANHYGLYASEANKKELYGMKVVETRDVEQFEVAYVRYR